MSGYHTYLLSSFPMLSFDGLPPFSYEHFIRKCEGAVSEREIQLLKSLPDALASGAGMRQHTLRRWIEFEVSVRNEAARLRAERLHWDAAAYLRPHGTVSPEITHAVQEARRSADPLHGERVLDQARWRMLDEFACGHYFDTEALIIYALKLQILLRWKRIRESDGKKQLEAAFGKIRSEGGAQ